MAPFSVHHDHPEKNEALKKVKQKFSAMSKEQQQKLCDIMGKLLIDLKTDWKSRPENAGKNVTYSELWRDFERNNQVDS